MRSLISIFMLLSCLSFNANARSADGILFSINHFQQNLQSKTSLSDGTSSDAESNDQLTDFKLGAKIGSPYIGIMQSSRSSKSGSDVTKFSAVGGSLGYFLDGGFFIMAHYLAQASLGSYKEGTGQQIDLGFISGISSSFFLGAEISHRSITYKENASITNFESYNLAEILPLFSVGFIF
jgi:hypothetical protein